MARQNRTFVALAWATAIGCGGEFDDEHGGHSFPAEPVRRYSTSET